MHRFLLALAVAACGAAPQPASVAPAPVIPAHADGMPGLTISRDAVDTLLRGLDTATVEKGFCAVAHMDTTVHYGPAFHLVEPQLHIVSAWPGDSVTNQTRGTVDFSCPKNVITVHWHLDDLGYYDFPSPTDTRSLEVTLASLRPVQRPVYDVIVARDSASTYHFIIFSVDGFARR